MADRYNPRARPPQNQLGYGSSYENESRAVTMRVMKVPTDDLALINCLIISPNEFEPNVHYVLVNRDYVFTIRPLDGFPPRTIGATNSHRKWAQLSIGGEVFVEPFDPYSEGMDIFLGSLTVDLRLFNKNQGPPKNTEWDAKKISTVLVTTFSNQIFAIGQLAQFDFESYSLVLTVRSLTVVDFEYIKSGLHGEVTVRPDQGQRHAQRGVLLPETTITISRDPTEAADAFKLKNARSTHQTSLINPDFKFEDMGIGGLDVEFSAIFRRAFASRIFPPSLVEKLGVQHVKGILLFGPPGTGKTLIARQIGKMLNAREPKIVNGPEILNKYVGQSEENIRKLFADAEKEYKAKGDDSSLHIIIFDELDAICKQRGSKNDGTGVGDSVVNQLLAKLDGVEQLNNILIIGMTNRKDMIDEALLRPGRLEVHMEIGLPDEYGRLQIYKIHTAKMRENGILDTDVNFDELASLSKNYSGAEIAGVVKAASSYAFNRHIKVGTIAGVTADVENMKVQRNDFLAALEEVRPAFGVADVELQQCVQNHILPFATNIKRILEDGQLFYEQVRHSSRTPLVSVLLHGPTGSGKTALAATIAMASEFPFIKLISPETMVGYSEASKVTEINKVFSDSYKSPLSVIVVDNIERLLDWVPIGPRFSNAVLQTLLVLFQKKPPKGRRLLILATTNQRQILDQMDMSEAFNSEIYVPTLTDLSAVDMVLEQLNVFTEQERERANEILSRAGVNKKLTIGIKKLLMIIEMAVQDVENKVDKFVNTIITVCGGKSSDNLTIEY